MAGQEGTGLMPCRYDDTGEYDCESEPCILCMGPPLEIERAKMKEAKPSAKGANIMDKQIGMRVRAARVEIKMSQEKLGELLGLTFQQVQKYEKGTNRIAGPRLIQIAKALQKSTAYFLHGLGDDNPNEGMDKLYEVLTIPGARTLIDSFILMAPAQRAALSLLAKEVVKHNVPA